MTAAIWRDCSPDGAGTSSIFIRFGELEKVMHPFHAKNPVELSKTVAGTRTEA